MSASPRMAAWCRAVVPSPAAALTSAPSFSRRRTVAKSPFCAASATGAGGAAARPAASTSATAVAVSICRNRCARVMARLLRRW